MRAASIDRMRGARCREKDGTDARGDVGAAAFAVPYGFSVNWICSDASWKSDCDIEPLLHIPANIIM